MLQVCARQAFVARVPHVHAPHSLRQGALDASSLVIEGFELRRFLPLARLFLDAILFFRIDGQGAPGMRGAAASLPQGTGLAILRPKGKGSLRITWTPTTAGKPTGVLTLHTSDPTHPTVTVKLLGSAR